MAVVRYCMHKHAWTQPCYACNACAVCMPVRVTCVWLPDALAIEFLSQAEGLQKLALPPGGSNTRWPYWIDCADWFAPATVRWENLLAFLLNAWLVAQGHEGIDLQAPGGRSDPVEQAQSRQSAALCGKELVSKIELIKDDARRQLLQEMCDPAIRIWLIFLAIYGRMSDLDFSMKRFLNFTQNDGAGVAFKAPAVQVSR